VLVEGVVGGHDRRDRGGHGLLDIAFRKRLAQFCLSLGTAHENDAQGLAIGTGRAELGQIVGLLQQGIGDRLVQPGIGRTSVGSGIAEDPVQRSIVQRHRHQDSWVGNCGSLASYSFAG